MQNSLLPRRVCESSRDPYIPEKGRAWVLEVSVGHQATACYEWETLSLTEHRPLDGWGDTGCHGLCPNG